MSRIAEAYRRSGAVPFAETAELIATPSLAESWISIRVPWELDESPTPEHSRETRALRTATRTAPEPNSVESHARIVADTAVSRDEMLHLVQRIVKGSTGGGPLGSLIFVGIDRERSADVCAATAEALADHMAGSICLVDANLRSPSLHAVFGVEQKRGFSDLLHDSGDVRACVQQLRSNLWLLSAGSCCAEDVPLLAGEQARTCLTDIRTTFDLVLVDTSPIGTYNNAIPLAAAVEAAVLVVEANATRREAAKKTVVHLTDANVRILGAVLTNRTFPIPTALYRKL